MTIFTDAQADAFATYASNTAALAAAMVTMSDDERAAFSSWLSDPDAQAAHTARMAAQAEREQRRVKADEAYNIARGRTAELLPDADVLTALDTISEALAQTGIVTQLHEGEPTKRAVHVLAHDGAYVTITRVPRDWVTDAQRGVIARDLAAQRNAREVGRSHSVRDM
jgi:hypothetical protein